MAEPSPVIRSEHHTESGITIRVVQGDLTEENVDAIVNAANEHLSHGGGVAGVIVRRGGRIIQDESNQWVQMHGPVKTGAAAITSAGSLPAKYVIHAVGPIWGTGDEHKKLSSAIRSALDIAVDHKLKSISFPAISSGIFGFPKDQCAQVFFATLTIFAHDHPDGSVREIRLCNIDKETTNIFESESGCSSAADHPI